MFWMPDKKCLQNILIITATLDQNRMAITYRQKECVNCRDAQTDVIWLSWRVSTIYDSSKIKPLIRLWNKMFVSLPNHNTIRSMWEICFDEDQASSDGHRPVRPRVSGHQWLFVSAFRCTPIRDYNIALTISETFIPIIYWISFCFHFYGFVSEEGQALREWAPAER